MRHIRLLGRGQRKAALWLLPLLVCAAGCGSPKISGKVTYKGEPLHMGLVVFTAANGWSGTAPINEDGSYSIANVPVGTVTVAVDSFGETGNLPARGKVMRRPRDEHAPPPPDAGPAGVKIPAKFKKADTSGLTIEVTGGRQTHDIKLE